MSGLGALRLPGGGGARAAGAVACAFDGTVLSGKVTNPGGGVSGLTVSIFIDGAGAAAGTAVTAANGSWTYTPAGLSAGPHSFIAKVALPTQGATSGTVAATAGSTGASADLSDANRSLSPLI